MAVVVQESEPGSNPTPLTAARRSIAEERTRSSFSWQPLPVCPAGGRLTSKGENLTATLSQRYLTAHGTSAFLNYLHLDVKIAGLVLVILLVGGLVNNTGAIRSIGLAMPDLASSADGPPLVRDTEKAKPALTPAMKAALDYVVQRYHVSAEALQPVFETAQTVGRERQIDPLLLIAVIGIESRFNPFSRSPMGALGLMQIIPRYHQDKIPQLQGERPFLDPVTNIQIGARILHEAVQRHGNLIEGLQYYAGALDDDERGYANKVFAEKLRLEQAPRRRDGANV
ncbi:MAG: transglycosylase SLT domain-containing protein [Betaproteobacteria bacterium]|nr:transglycosylase SLT domain-containing protein [Rhodocyclales bacterium]